MNDFERNVRENTLLDDDRLNALAGYARVASKMSGDFAELGVYRGGSALFLARFMMPHQRLFLFDTFEGLPDVGPEDTKHVKGEFAATFDQVRYLLARNMHQVSIYKGVFPDDTAFAIKGKVFSLVHIDCDLYAGVRAGLEWFGPRMLTGGVIVLDDVYCPDCPGAMKAVQEFLGGSLTRLENRVHCQAALYF
jgi:O-methyltransferase